MGKEEDIKLSPELLFACMFGIIMGVFGTIVVIGISSDDFAGKIGRLDRINGFLEKYVRQDPIRIAQFTLNSNTTIGQMKVMYYSYKTNPATQNFLLEQFNYICDG